MKTKRLRTTVNNKYIFELEDLSYHTKTILVKMMADFAVSSEPLDMFYLQTNIFGIWPEDTVWDAMNELADAEIMFIDMNDCDCENCHSEEESEEHTEEPELLLFSPDFIQEVCPYLGYCICCNPAPANFNISYN